MIGRSPYRLAVVLTLSVAFNVALAAAFLASRPAREASGQTANSGAPFILGTEKSADQMPMCFVLRTQDPHMLVYRIDGTGRLQLLDSRDIACDLLIRDGHFNFQGLAGGTTLPSVSRICGLPKPPEKVEKKAEEKKAEAKKSEAEKAEGKAKKAKEKEEEAEEEK